MNIDKRQVSANLKTWAAIGSGLLGAAVFCTTIVVKVTSMEKTIERMEVSMSRLAESTMRHTTQLEFLIKGESK